jgi:chromosome segregation ATPase
MIFRGSGSDAPNQSKLEKLHEEAKTVLEQKAKMVRQFQMAVEEAESELGRLQTELATQTKLAQELSNHHIPMADQLSNQDLIDSVRAEHETEIDKAEERHKREVQRLQQEMKTSLEAAEQWSEKHAEMVCVAKRGQLEELRRQVDEARATVNRNSLSATQARNKFHQQSKNASLMKSQRLQFLESQVGELNSASREELRDIKAKIDECLAAVDLREREHKNEVRRYEDEITEREQQYAVHMNVLTEQFRCEKERLRQVITAASSKVENLQRILKQLEKQHETQLQSTLHDVERMKNYIYQSRTRDTDKQNETRNYVANVNQLQRDCTQIEQELALVETEIKDLRDENKDLKVELQKFDNVVYGSSQRI